MVHAKREIIMRITVLYLLAFIFIAILLGIAAYLQLYKGINPCPLCTVQRVIMGILSISFLLGIALGRNRIGQILIGLLSALISITGIIFAGRQVWLQHVPSAVPNSSNCEASLGYMLHVLPCTEVIAKVFQGGPVCAKVDWQCFTLSLAEWSFCAFIFFFVFSLWQLRRPTN